MKGMSDVKGMCLKLDVGSCLWANSVSISIPNSFGLMG